MKKIQKKKYVQYLKTEKVLDICIEVARQTLQARPKITKKLSEHQIKQSKRRFSH
jgi:hypothetical protein